MKLSERIFEYRVTHNLSQTEFAELCKITRQSVYNYEHGIVKPSTLTYRKILKVIKGDEEDETV